MPERKPPRGARETFTSRDSRVGRACGRLANFHHEGNLMVVNVTRSLAIEFFEVRIRSPGDEHGKSVAQLAYGKAR